jgi:hypothetical protein
MSLFLGKGSPRKFKSMARRKKRDAKKKRRIVKSRGAISLKATLMPTKALPQNRTVKIIKKWLKIVALFFKPLSFPEKFKPGFYSELFFFTSCQSKRSWSFKLITF